MITFDVDNGSGSSGGANFSADQNGAGNRLR